MNDKSILEILHEAKSTMKINFGKIVGFVLLFGFSIFLLCFFPFIGISVATFAFGFLSLGFVDSLLAITKKNQITFENLFSKYKQCIPAFCMKVVRVFYIFLWSLLFIFPGIVCLLNYSFATLIMVENKDIDSFSALKRSKNIAYGYRTNLLFLYFYFLIVVLLTFSISMLIPLFASIFISVPIWSLFLVASMITISLTTFVYFPFFQLTLIKFYLEIKDFEHENKKDILKISRKTNKIKKSKSTKNTNDVKNKNSRTKKHIKNL